MRTIQLGFKAFDPHELLCHFVASKAGLYEQADLRVELIDITFTPDAELPPETFQVSCGAALVTALKDLSQRVVFVATDRPMFWLYASNEIPTISDLKGHKIATYPVIAPPAQLARILLRQAGLNGDTDVELAPARDDTARLGLLRSGSVAAALLSSAVPQPRVEELGFRTLAFVGDSIRVPTTGLAVHETMLNRDPELVGTVARVLNHGLDILNNDSELVGTELYEYFDVPADLVEPTTRLLVDKFTANGRTEPAIAQGAIDRMREALGITQPRAWTDVYDFSLLDE